jgi:hypothetical protein
MKAIWACLVMAAAGTIAVAQTTGDSDATATKTVLVVNQVSLPITQILIVREGQEESRMAYSKNALDDAQLLSPNQQKPFLLKDKEDVCQYILTAILVDRRQAKKKIDLCMKNPVWRVAKGDIRNLFVQFFNNDTDDIIHLHIVNATVARRLGWGDDLLRNRGALLSDDEKIINVYRGVAGCLYNVKVTYADKKFRVFKDVDFCEAERYYFGLEGFYVGSPVEASVQMPIGRKNMALP